MLTFFQVEHTCHLILGTKVKLFFIVHIYISEVAQIKTKRVESHSYLI